MSNPTDTPTTACTLCAEDGTIGCFGAKIVCPVCDGKRSYDPTPLSLDHPVSLALAAIETWRAEWAEHDRNLKATP